MITKQRQLFYFVGDTPYKDLADAQKADLMSIMPEWTPGNKQTTADWLLAQKDAIVDTLTTSPRSRLRARKLHGAKRKTKNQPATEPKP